MIDLIQFLINTAEKLKSGILSFFGKADDAYNEYDLSLTVTDYHYGEEFEPTNKKVYGKKFKISLDSMIGAVLAFLSALSLIRIVKSIFSK